jgi:hypothetical protein
MWTARLFMATIALCACGVTAALAAAGSAAHAGQHAATTTKQMHGFDFLFGSWTLHYTRLRHPLSGSHDWIGFDGASTVRPMWDGRGNVEDGELRMQEGRVLGVTVRIYNDTTHQWSIYWGTNAKGMLGNPQIGRFDANGVGEFFAPDTFKGRKVVIRYKWMHADADHARFEQAFSPDNGKTWETNWTTDYTRAKTTTP